ncbi:MAG: DUF305 domain-containing protein [Patulibacter minatonensis]
MRPAARLFATSLAVVTLGASLTACGDSDAPDGGNASGAAATQAAGTAAATGAETPAAADHAAGGHDDHASGAADGAGADSGGGKSTGGTADDAVDQAFVRQMIPHHEMAVGMAEAVRGSTKRRELATLAGAIASAQRPEIGELKLIAKNEGLSTKGASGAMQADARALGLSEDALGMDHGGSEAGDDGDRAFLDQMTAHHVGAVAMAKAELKSGKSEALRAIASDIVRTQELEIAVMKRWRTQWFGNDKSAR